MATQTARKKFIVLVGASSGVGFAALESLLASGNSYHILLGSRQPLEPWRYGQISSSLQASNSSFDRLPLDLSRYDSVRQFSRTLLTTYPDQIDSLLLCAGKISGRYHRTVDGEEETLQVNVLSHALLIDLLEPKLGPGNAQCRILIVTSGLHRQVPEGTINPENLENHLTYRFDPMEVYQITKLIQIFLMFAAKERFDAERRSVSVVAVSPGFIPDTGLSREMNVFKRGVTQWLLPRTPIATTMPDGGRTISRGITQDFPSGTYFSQRKVEETAEETYNPQLRESWKQFFIAKRVWHPGPPSDSVQPAPVHAPMTPPTQSASGPTTTAPSYSSAQPSDQM